MLPRHPPQKPPEDLLTTFLALKAYYPENRHYFLCLALSDMADDHEISRDEYFKAVTFIEGILHPECSYMAWLARTNRPLWQRASSAEGNDTGMRHNLRQEWLEYLTT